MDKISNIEEGLLASSLVVDHENANYDHSIGRGGVVSDSSSVTAAAIISTAVAVCGTFGVGCAVSSVHDLCMNPSLL